MTKLAHTQGITAANATKLLQEIAKESGDPLMPLQQLAILTALYSAGELSQSALDGLTNVTGKNTNSRNVIKLGRGNASLGPGLDLLEQVEDLMDHRAKRIRLTPRGRKFIEMAFRTVYPHGVPQPSDDVTSTSTAT